VDPSDIVRHRVIALFVTLEQVTLIGQAERATQAIVAMCVLRPDLVILDIQMPDGRRRRRARGRPAAPARARGDGADKLPGCVSPPAVRGRGRRFLSR
jgi:DNA-binding NarL/FixJ family response regulator